MYVESKKHHNNVKPTIKTMSVQLGRPTHSPRQFTVELINSVSDSYSHLA